MSERSTTRTILIVDDHDVVRVGLRLVLEREPDFEIVGEAVDRSSALDMAIRSQPDIVVLDLDLGGESGMDLIPTLIATVPGVRILVLTGMRDGDIQRSAVQVGAVGLVEKDEVLATLVPAIRKVAQGQVWLDPALVASVLQEMVRARGASEPDADGLRISRLTERERDVIRLICQGLTNRVIAERLVISETTVRHHLTSIFSKLEVENRLELVIYAFRNGLATLD